MLHAKAEALGGHSYRQFEAASLVSALAEPLGRRLYSHSLTLRLASESAERRDCRLDRRSRAAWMLSAHPAFLRRRLIRYYRPIFLPRPALRDVWEFEFSFHPIFLRSKLVVVTVW